MGVKVAITGGIGSGKSYVCSILREKGVEIFDCDNAAKRVIRGNAEVRRKLTELIGPDTFTEKGLNKAAVSSFLLASEDNARKVNGIVHPAVAEEFIGSGIAFMECAILFTSGFDRLVDKTVCVTAPLEVRVERIMRRDGISREKALEWINCQMSQEEVAARCDCVICNDGKRDIGRDVEALLEKLKD